MLIILNVSIGEGIMPSTEKIDKNHKCSRCSKKIYAGEKATIHRYYGKTDYRHENLHCKDKR